MNRIAALVVASVTALAGPALALDVPTPEGVCGDAARPDGPLPAGFHRGDHGVARRACPRTEAGIGLGGRAVVEPQNFYANLVGHLRVDGSIEIAPRLELFGALELLEAQQVISSFRAGHLGLGNTSLGATWLFHESDEVGLAAFGRATLPTALGLYQRAFPVGGDIGVTGVVVPIEPIRLRAAAFGTSALTLGGGAPTPRAGFAGQIGMDVAPWHWLALSAELNGAALYAAPLDHAALGLGARFAIWEGLGAEIGAVVPLAGRERNLATAIARVSWRFL